MVKKNKQLAVVQSKELEDWSEKVRSGEADKITRNLLLSGNYLVDCDPKCTLRNVTEKITPKILNKTFPVNAFNKEEADLISQFSIDFGIENDLSMVEAVEVRYRGLIMNLRRELIKEYECKTYSEKALVDLATSAYARNLSMSKCLVNTAGIGHTTSNLNQFMGIMSKEVDRANRHFISALETLRQLKQPELKINVKTNTAFISQNQQFNNNQNETLEAK